MARGSSRSSSSKSSSRTSKLTNAPSAVQQPNQAAKPSMMSGLAGSLMTGMAFGAGAELMRGLFRNQGMSNMLSYLMAGGAGFITYKGMGMSTKYSANKFRIPASIVAALVTYSYMKVDNYDERI